MCATRNILAFGGLLIIGLNSTHTFARDNYPKVYPFKPFKTKEINNAVKRISEDNQAITNFNDIISKNLSRAKTKNKPWTSTYWPLNKGLIADSYESTRIGYYVERGFISWTKNYRTFIARKNGVLNNIDSLNEGQLATLAPSEKYDLLLGDKSFDLTHRLWDYMKRWGNKKQYGFLSDLFLEGKNALEQAQMMVDNGWFDSLEDAFKNAYQLQGSLSVERALYLVKSGKYSSIEKAMPEALAYAEVEANNYVLEKKNNLMAFWEGICHGWSTAAGVVPRPRRSVDIKLPDGRNLRFYPTDIKALASLLWANSLIQDNKLLDNETGKNIGGGVISQGLRCNLKSPKKDEWGRYYDNQPDPFSNDHSPRCVGVHPAIWHLGLVNLIGKQGRSFVVERKVGEEVDNHPMYSYKMEYFNPNNGRSYRNINKNIERIDSDDQFRKFRNPEAAYIVGVETTMVYIDWQRPTRYVNDDERFDKTEDKNMYYDLELNENFEVVGGQWRAFKTGKGSSFGGPHNRYRSSRSNRGNHQQPDFFWVITKDWKPFFKEEKKAEAWRDKTKAPPASWLKYAKEAHEFIYNKKFSFGTGQKCKMYHKRTGKMKEVSCEFEDPKPQPFINLVNSLVNLAK